MVLKNLIILQLLLPITLFAQRENIVIDSCGLNSSDTLNPYEVTFFNHIHAKRLGDSFSYEGKKVAFFQGDRGGTYLNKKNYFDWDARQRFRDSQGNGDLIFLLTPIEKEISGGYDIFIVSWAKFGISTKRREKLVKRLGRKSQRAQKKSHKD